jgi:23S rRNA (adenine2503-C2)-methyltransferase
MPIEAKYSLTRVLELARRYVPPSGGRVTFEYVLLKGVNDRTADAKALVRCLGDLGAKVNLIPLNAALEVPFEPPTAAALAAFVRILSEARIPVSVRQPRGQDVLAACGQLHLQQPDSSATTGS